MKELRNIVHILQVEDEKLRLHLLQIVAMTCQPLAGQKGLKDIALNSKLHQLLVDIIQAKEGLTRALGGYFYLVESKEEVEKLLDEDFEYGIDDARRILNNAWVEILQITNNEGGNTYFIPDHLVVARIEELIRLHKE